MSELFVVGISWRTAEVAVREKLAFREDELPAVLSAVTGALPVAEAVLLSTCNRVELYGVSKPGADAASAVRAFIADDRKARSTEVMNAIYDHRGPAAIRHVFRVASSLDSLVVGEAQILGQLKSAYALAGGAGTSGPVLARALERAFRVAKRVRTETTIARGSANVASVAVELANNVFGKLEGKHELVVGAGKMSSLAARPLNTTGAATIVVTNRSPDKAAALADEIDGAAAPWSELETLLAKADVVISSTGAREPILTRALFKRVMKARRWKPIVVIDIAVPRDAETEIEKIDGVFRYDIDDLEKVVRGTLADRAKAAEQAGAIVEHEAVQFEQWQRTRGVVPTINALRGHFNAIAEAELQKAIDQLERRDHTPAQSREAMQRTIRLVINKLLHQPTTALRGSAADEGSLRASVLADLFGLELATDDGREPADEPEQSGPSSEPPDPSADRKAQA